MVNKPPRAGTIGRGLRLGKLGLSLTGSYLGYQAQNLLLGESPERQRRFHESSSRRIREELGSLKGAAMKLGQIMSLQNQLLPQAFTQELASLQMRAPAMHPTLARAQFKSSMGRYPEEVFRQFDPEPFAAASLGQVHRAITQQGERVAVKIQYPAIRDAIENDFKLLRSATSPVRLSGHIPTAILHEIERGFLEETDYLHEASNLEYFREGLASLPYVTVPRAFRQLSTDRVLTMSFVEGESIDQFLKRRLSATQRTLTGQHLLELYYFQLHRIKALQADQHPGNYLFLPDGRIGMVDFGCVKRIKFDAGLVIRGCINRTWRQDGEPARQLLAQIFGANTPYSRAKKMIPNLEVMARAWFPEGAKADAPHDFGQSDLMTVLTEALRKTLKVKATNPEFAFVSRAELGLYNLLHRLDAKINPRQIWKRVEGGSSRAS